MADPLRYFVDENLAQGLPPGPSARFQAGVNNYDNGALWEQGITLPWVIDPASSWLYYRCWLESYLDSGMVLHKPLPQSPQTTIDTLAAGDLAFPQAQAEEDKTGVNTISVGGFADVAQRMATSTYRFVLKGHAIRAGYKIPIPGLKTVCGVVAIPDEHQYGVNVPIGNLSGVPLWMARWELWYFVTLPPHKAVVPPANIAEHIRGDARPPTAVQAPFSQQDQNAVTGQPRREPIFFVRPGG